MKIKRECATLSMMCLIRTDVYISTLAHFEVLFEEALKDFPNLKPEEVTIRYYSEPSFEFTFGIEFKVGGIIPNTYTRREYMPRRY